MASANAGIKGTPTEVLYVEVLCINSCPKHLLHLIILLTADLYNLQLPLYWTSLARLTVPVNALKAHGVLSY